MRHDPSIPHNESQSILHVLRDRIAADLKCGKLEHGDRLPSVREVGEEFAADPRVVLAAYQQLVEEGLVEIRARSGVFATGAVTPIGSALALPRRWILETVLGAISRDIPPARLVDHLRATMLAKRTRVAVLECNTDQMVSMAEELSVYFGCDVLTVELDAAHTPGVVRQLRDADLLVSASHDELVERIAKSVGKPFVITSVRPELMARLVRLIARGPVYFLVGDPRFGAKMRRLVAPMSCSENFHVLVASRDDLGIIPRGAPTYVMRSAQASATNKHGGREIPPQRIFSEETGREILSRILSLSSEPPPVVPHEQHQPGDESALSPQ